MIPLSIPANPDDLTAAWLTAALAGWASTAPLTAAVDPLPLTNFAVSNFTVTPLGENRGFYGQPVRLTLEYAGDVDGAPRNSGSLNPGLLNKAPFPRTLIAKFSSANQAMRQRAVDSYLREVRFYQHLAPHSDLPTPICYHAAIDLTSGDHILLLQELAPAQAITRLGGCSPDQARLAIRAISKLHAAWWDKTNDPRLDWLNDAPAPHDHEAARLQYNAWWSLFYEQAKAHLPTDFVDISRNLGQHSARLRRHLFYSAPRTLIHRDFQLDNLIFGEELPGHESRHGVAILDWQFLSRGRGLFDLAYFLSENLLTNDSTTKHAIEVEILRDYHAALYEYGIAQYSLSDCLRDFRIGLLQRHSALVSTIAAMPFSAEQRHFHLNVLLPRNIASIRDHKAVKALLLDSW